MQISKLKMILIQDGNVYLCTKPTFSIHIPYEIWHSEPLSRKYRKHGQEALDREIIKMLFEGYEIEGNHESVTRYLKVSPYYNSEASAVFCDCLHTYAMAKSDLPKREKQKLENALLQEMYDNLFELLSA